MISRPVSTWRVGESYVELILEQVEREKEETEGERRRKERVI